MRKVAMMTLLAIALGASGAWAIGVGIGGYGGFSIPIVNDLSEQGSTFGIRVPVKLSPMFVVEPYYASSALGDVEETFGTPVTYTRDGGETSGFGANVLLKFGTGFSFFPFVGIGTTELTRSGAEDISDVTYNFGLGLGFSPMPKLGIDVRGELSMIATGDTSQKFGNITAGVYYDLFSSP